MRKLSTEELRNFLIASFPLKMVNCSTKSSTNYYSDEWNDDFFNAPINGDFSGRLMVYDPIPKKSIVLKENIHMV